MVLLAMPTPRRPPGLAAPSLPSSSPTMPGSNAPDPGTVIAGSRTDHPDLDSIPTTSVANPAPVLPSRNHGQGQQLLSPVLGLLRAATASPVAAAAAAAAGAVYALTSAAATASSPCLLAGPSASVSTTSSSSASTSRQQRLRTFSTTSCGGGPSPLLGLADDLVQALLHGANAPQYKHAHVVGPRSRTASLDHARALRSSSTSTSASTAAPISPSLGMTLRADSAMPAAALEPRISSLPLTMPARASPPHLPLMTSPPVRVSAPAPSSSALQSVQPWALHTQQQQHQLPTPTLQITHASLQDPAAVPLRGSFHQQPQPLSLSARPMAVRPSLFFARRRKNNNGTNNARITPQMPTNHVAMNTRADDDPSSPPAGAPKPLGLFTRSFPPACTSLTLDASSSDSLDTGYLADSEHDPKCPSVSVDTPLSPPFTPHSLLFAHPSPARYHAPPMVASPAVFLPPPIPIPSSVQNHHYLDFPTRIPASTAPSLVCPQPTRSTTTFQFSVVPAYDPTISPHSAPIPSPAAAAGAFPVIAPSPVAPLNTPPRTFVHLPPSPIVRPGFTSEHSFPVNSSSPQPPSRPSPLLAPPPGGTAGTTRLVAPRPVRALPHASAEIKSMLVNGLPPRTESPPVSPLLVMPPGGGSRLSAFSLTTTTTMTMAAPRPVRPAAGSGRWEPADDAGHSVARSGLVAGLKPLVE